MPIHTFSDENRQTRRNYEYFERKRLRELKLNEAYSMFYLKSRGSKKKVRFETRWGQDKDDNDQQRMLTLSRCNTLLPFATMGKTTCGAAFSDEADHRRQQIDVPPADITRWRCTGNSNAASVKVKDLKVEHA